jgi:UPF0176 protein
MSNPEILLYYKYVNIDDPEAIKKWQQEIGRELNLRGRILIAQEGINGTLEGEQEATQEYIRRMKAHPLFDNIHWKVSNGVGDAFPRWAVKVRNEIVSLHLGEEDFTPTETTGNHLSPDDMHDWYESGKEFYVVDMRNDYELDVGEFDGTIFPGLENFRDLPKQLKTIGHLKDKTVLTVCTGGVRCEKASGYLIKKGFTGVHQLDGGIVSYMKKHPGEHFKGSLYTFDSRTVMHFDTREQHTTIGRCRSCQKPSERYGNCAYQWCNRHIILCEGCKDTKVFCRTRCALLNAIKRLL